MIKEIKVLFVAMVAMMMLTGVASAVDATPSIELTDPINSANVNAVEITGTGFPVGEFAWSIKDDEQQIVYGTGTVAGDENISVIANVSTLVDGTLLATVVAAPNYMVTDTATKDTVAPDAPAITLTDPINLANEGIVMITGTGEAGAEIYYEIHDDTGYIDGAGTTVDGSGIISVTGIDVSVLDDGILTAYVWLVDAAGNEGAEGIDTATKDTVAPDAPAITLTDPINLANEGIVEITGTGEAGAEVYYEIHDDTGYIDGAGTTVDGSGIISVTGIDVSVLDDGILTAYVWLVDAAGNEGAEGIDTATKDTVAPTVMITSTAADPTNTSPIPMTVAFSEFVTGFTVDDIVVVGGTAGNFAGSAADYTFDITATGEVLVTANIAADMAVDTGTNGNIAADEYSINFDDEAPSAPTITLLDPINIANVAAVMITGTGEVDASIKFDIEDEYGVCIDGTGTVDGDGNISVTGINVSDLDDGDLIAYVWLTDAAGNEGLVGTAAATKDTVAPIADAGPDQTIILGDTVQFNGSDSYDPDAGTIISYSWDFGDSSGTSTNAEPSYEYEQYGTYTVTLTVTDAAGNMNTDTMTVTHGIKLNVGWNLISTPLIPDNTSIEVVLSDVDDATIVWEYDADTSSWLSYIPGPNGPGGSLTEIAVGIGYWIDMSGDDTLVIEGTYLEEGANTPPTYPVYEGWNLIGVHSLDLRLAETYLSSTSFDCAHTLHGYQDSAWINIDLHSDDLEPGYGYWAYMTEDGAIAP